MTEHSLQKTSAPITAIVVALGIVASTAVNPFLMTLTPAYAAPGKDKVIERNQGKQAFAFWDDISVEVRGIGTVVSAHFDVIETEQDTILYVILFTEDGNFADGLTTIDPNAFDIDKKLTTATLSPVKIEVVKYDEFSNEIGRAEITIQATWEGTGELSTEKDKGHFKSENFREHFAQSSQFRDATAEGSINDVNLGTSDFAELLAFKLVDIIVSENIIT
jgi:hypothetical protein